MKTLDRLVAPFEVKELDEDARTFTGYAAAWSLDLGDDRIHQGAFKESIAAWRKSKQAMPLINSHHYFDINSVIGQLLDAEEDDVGLLTKWEVIDGKDGDAVLTRLRPSRRTGRAPLGSMSMGYEAQKFDFEDSDASTYGQIRNLRKVALKEVSLVIFPMNPDATIDVSSVKLQMKHASAEAIAEVRSFLDEIANAEVVDLTDEPPDPAAETSAWATPGDTPLDRLKVQRLLTRHRAV